jgi:hypothetical protein
MQNKTLTYWRKNTMTKFYATGVKQVKSKEVDENGKNVTVQRSAQVVIDIDPEGYGITRAAAQNEAEYVAKRDGISLDGFGVRVVQGTQKGGSTMTKYAKERKRLRGLASKRKK